MLSCSKNEKNSLSSDFSPIIVVIVETETKKGEEHGENYDLVCLERKWTLHTDFFLFFLLLSDIYFFEKNRFLRLICLEFAAT
jgi:hypothetical protein